MLIAQITWPIQPQATARNPRRSTYGFADQGDVFLWFYVTNSSILVVDAEPVGQITFDTVPLSELQLLLL